MRCMPAHRQWPPVWRASRLFCDSGIAGGAAECASREPVRTPAGFRARCAGDFRPAGAGAFGGAWNPKADPDEFQNFREAPLAKIAMNFRLVERDAAHCTVITETRVYAGGAPVVRRVAAYWRVIYPGSALMRHIWLRAIKLRAEGAK